MSTKQCPKCVAEMKKGFFYVRNSEHPIFHNYVVWVEGEKKDITKFMGSNAGVQQFPCYSIQVRQLRIH
jgi:hypothetical protein